MDLRVRPAVLAGTWYPGRAEELRALLDEAFDNRDQTARPLGKPVRALVLPHAGYAFSGRAAVSAVASLRGADIRRVVLLAPSHRSYLEGFCLSSYTHYETPLGRLSVDREAIAMLAQHPLAVESEQVEAFEHSLEILLPILQHGIGDFMLVPIVVGEIPNNDEIFASIAEKLLALFDEKTILVASSDFTHRGRDYGFEVTPGSQSIEERLSRLDNGAVECILSCDRKKFLDYVQRTGATICGAKPIGILLDCLARMEGVESRVVSRYTSSHVTGDWSNSVSYVGIAFAHSGGVCAKQQPEACGDSPFVLTDADKKDLLDLARRSLETAVMRGAFDDRVLRGVDFSQPLRRHAGAFVSLKCAVGPGAICIGRGCDLRGCIGTIASTAPVFDTVARRAASSALDDPRFPRPVSVSELPFINIEISVLTPPVVVTAVDDIEVGRHGVILTKGPYAATFLPQVAKEQGWDRETMLAQLSLKAGLGLDGWRQGASFEVYEAIVFSEEELDGVKRS